MEINLKKYSHIIWDWNGTLINDTWLCVQILNESLQQRNINPLTLHQYQSRFDFPVKDFYRDLGFDFSVDSFEEIAEQFIDKYEARQVQCSLQHKAITVLQAFTDRRFCQSILSAYHQEKLEEAVKFFQVEHFFTKIVGLQDYYAKSKIEHGRSLIKNLNINPAEALLIGDTTHDFEVACQIGTDCLLIADGHQQRPKLLSCGVCVLDSLEQILEHLP